MFDFKNSHFGNLNASPFSHKTVSYFYFKKSFWTVTVGIITYHKDSTYMYVYLFLAAFDIQVNYKSQHRLLTSSINLVKTADRVTNPKGILLNSSFSSVLIKLL